MGNRLSPEERAEKRKERAAEAEINKELVTAKIAEKDFVKMLLLGTGACGKSTIFKQLVGLYGEGFSPEERQNYRLTISKNVISSIKQLIEASEALEEEIYTIDEENHIHVDFMNGIPDSACVLTPEMLQAIEALWKDPALKACFMRRGEFHILDSAGYFLDKIAMFTPDYIPTMDDILHSRSRTTGINEKSFTIERKTFTVIDVGGQKNERKKWIHSFDGVTSLVFIAALNEFDQTLYEDDAKNAMDEALDVFEKTISLQYFKEMPVILFLNKSDLLKEKIENSDISSHFPDFKGDSHSFDEVSLFIKRKFLERKDPEKPVYTHITCATDTENVRFTFEAVKSIIISKNVGNAGILE